MKIEPGAPALFLCLALTALTGCGTHDAAGSDEVPLVGTSTSRDAADAMEKVSNGLYDLIGVKGRRSDSLPGVTECQGKDPARYFQIFHPWSFFPDSADRLDEAMERLRTDLPGRGWKVVRYGPDTSRAGNLDLTADHTESSSRRTTRRSSA